MNGRYVAVLAAAALMGCTEPIPEARMNYVGHWQSPEMSLLIVADGTVAYERKKNGGSTSINAPLTQFKGDDFDVGFGFFSTTFEVSKPPGQVDGQWQMVVDGVRLTRAQ